VNDKIPNIAVFLSGGGSNLQALIDASESQNLNAVIKLVVSSKKKAFGLKRAEDQNIKTEVYRERDFENFQLYEKHLLEILRNSDIDYIALSGYLKLIPALVIENYRGKILNIHPALLPKYGGKGMYGRHVHQAVIDNQEKESGATVHLADEIYDHGKILAQGKVTVEQDDTPESLQKKILQIEHKLYPETIEKYIRGEI